MTVLVVLAMLLAAAQQDALQPVHRAHAALAECAVTVTVEARANSGATRFEYDLWRTGPKRFRVDLRTSGPDAADALERRVVGDGSRVLLYEPATNRYVPGIYAPEGRLIDAVSALMGRVDPFTQVYLDADDGLKRFLAQFGALEFERIADRGGRSVFSASGGEAGAPIVVTVEVNRATNLTSRVLLDAGGGLGATWTVRAAPTSAEEALRFRVPGDARSVTELRDEPPAAVIESDDARKVIERSRKAYDDLNTFSFSSRAFLFPEGPEQKRLANCWWAKGGRRRFVRFCALYAATLAVNVAINSAALFLLGGGEPALAMAFLAATGASATLNFLGMKFLVFKPGARPRGRGE
ncbi:MAG: hypothetical protein IH851_09445 [Armatimonadetes bacterium]|nr:hypothetical protein [Armatimonadota bacterium]